jgi:ABC-2 type transport system ATP-binding protein
MIDLKAVNVRRGSVEIHPTTLNFAAGRHALVGKPEDGVSLLLACFAGEVRPRKGKLHVLGGDARDPKVRARVAYIPLRATLPDVLRVDETLALARRIRGEDADPKHALAALTALGLSALAGRRNRTLDPGELRAVAVAEALASPLVSVVLIEEPFVSMAAPAAAALPRALAREAKKCIVVSTASSHDASRVAESFALFERGRLLRVTADVPPKETHESPRIHIVTSGARMLAAALAKRPDVLHLELSEGGVRASGKDALALAAAVNAAILESEADVVRIEPEGPPS